ncbi:MAG: filamentation induced by cAMP protein Fic, partial [Actinoallomurus sp.]|nr:filamentation induced by cAMP protein Fic [Actinoallomurus sp.]
MNDPFSDVTELPTVPEAVAEARESVDRLLGHRILRRRSAEVSAESALRGARASAALEGVSAPLEDVRGGLVTDPVTQGALRVSAELGSLAGTWHNAPRQALARLHALAAADGVDSDDLGRPRSAGDARDPLEIGP